MVSTVVKQLPFTERKKKQIEFLNFVADTLYYCEFAYIYT